MGLLGPLAREQALRKKDFLAQRMEEFYNQCHDESGRFCEGEDGPGRKRDNLVGRRRAGEKSIHTPPSDSERAGIPEWVSRKQMEIWNTYKTPEHRADFIEELEYRRIHGVARPKKVKPSNQPIGGPNGPQKDEEGWRPYGTKRALIGSSGGRNHLKDRLLEVGITPKILSDEAVLKKIRTERPLEVNHVNSSKPGQNPEWVYSFDELDGVKLGITIDRRNGGISTVYPTEMKREELKEYLDELYGG